MISLKDKVMLVTGGSRGIGRGIVLMAARAGANVAINFRENKEAAAATAAEAEKYGIKAMTVQADVGRVEQCRQMVQSVVGAFGQLDVVVANAGIWEHNPVDTMTDESLARTIDVNLYGVFHPVRAAVPQLKRQKSGSIILIASTAGVRGEAYYSPYAATKGAVISLTKSWAGELADDGIRVNCVAPGWVHSDMTEAILQSPEGDKVRDKILLRRAGQPEEIGGPVVFLASELATFITGEILNVNGGAVLCG